MKKGGRGLRHVTPGQVLGRFVEEAGLGVEDGLLIFSASRKTSESWSQYIQGDPDHFYCF